MKKLIIEIADEVYKTVQDGSYCGSLYEELKAAKLYNPTGEAISREAINSEIEKRYCDKHCVVPSEEPYCPDNCPARFLKNIVKECPTVPQVTVFTDNADKKAIEEMKAELQNVIDARPQGEWVTDNIGIYCSVCKKASR